MTAVNSVDFSHHLEIPDCQSAIILRLVDLFFCIAALIICLPVLLVVAAVIWAQDRGPIIYRQRRFGWHGRSFQCLKFRTMVMDADERLRLLLEKDPMAREEWERDQKLRHDPRVTRIGSVLRKLSLDELPQLLNVLMGDMSLVGPRPIIADEAIRYGHRYWTYCHVRPGITGIWQISGRNDVRYSRRVAMDVMYARKLSLRLYLSVLLSTPAALLLRRGAY